MAAEQTKIAPGRRLGVLTSDHEKLNVRVAFNASGWSNCQTLLKHPRFFQT